MNTKNIKPFNLEAALAGEPVMLRNGMKAFVRHHETELNTVNSKRLLGYTANGAIRMWCENGSYSSPSETTCRDIIGMYPTSKTHIINGFEVPAPETEEPKRGDWYYRVCLIDSDFYDSDRWNGDDVHDVRPLKRGLIFLKKEDAIANAKAMLGIDPHVETEA